MWTLYGPARIGAEVGAGHQWIVHDGAGQARGDSLALRAHTAGRLGWATPSGVEANLRFGAATDVITLDGTEDTAITPLLGLELGYAF